MHRVNTPTSSIGGVDTWTKVGRRSIGWRPRSGRRQRRTVIYKVTRRALN
jgi:hypothetical protein